LPKIVHGNWYVHRDNLRALPSEALATLEEARRLVPPDAPWNLVKVDRGLRRVTFSWYPGFEEEAHPELREYVTVDLDARQARTRKESRSNPSILHRKEAFVADAHPRRAEYAALTRQEEAAGLYAPEKLRVIGRKLAWEGFLRQAGVRIEGHRLLQGSAPRATPRQATLGDPEAPDARATLRLSGRTTMSRRGPSSLAQLVVGQGLIDGPVFDWGCGKGKDIEHFRASGLEAEGWDPAHRPHPPPSAYPGGRFTWVHCAFVLNTLADPRERARVLDDIFAFLPPGGHLAIAVRSATEIDRLRTPAWQACADGWLTTSRTFQKGFSPEELLELVRSRGFQAHPLARDPVAVLGRKPS